MKLHYCAVQLSTCGHPDLHQIWVCNVAQLTCQVMQRYAVQMYLTHDVPACFPVYTERAVFAARTRALAVFTPWLVGCPKAGL